MVRFSFLQSVIGIYVAIGWLFPTSASAQSGDSPSNSASQQLQASDPYITFFAENTHGAYSVLCVTPCVVSLAPGAYRFALAEGDGDPVAADDRVAVRGNMLLIGNYHDADGQRLAGALIIIASLGIGAGLIAADQDGPDNSLFYAGAATGLGGSLLGTLLWALSSDSASIAARPLP